MARKPLVLVMARTPSLSADDKRPSFPHYTLPSYLMADLARAGFDAAREFQLAVVESPGRMRNTRAGLEAVLRWLPELFPFDADRIVFVGDGHGAAGPDQRP